MLQHTIGFLFYGLIILHYIYLVHFLYPFIHPCIWRLSISWLLWIYFIEYRTACVSLRSSFQFFWIHTQKWDWCIICKSCFYIFEEPSHISIIYISISITSSEGFQFFYIFTNTWIFGVFLVIIILTDFMWYRIVVLTCISCIISNVENLSIYLWPSVCLLLSRVYSNLSSIFNCTIFVFLCLLLCYVFPQIFQYILDITTYQIHN
jgi:hypothetical protein